MLILRGGTIPFGGGDNAELLSKHGISCDHCESGREALGYLQLCDYDLLLIDLDLPDMPGYEALRLARAAGHATPSIVLAPLTPWRIKVKALDQGADDFVTMPCDPDELLARVRAVVRRGQTHAQSVLRLGPVELDQGNHDCRVNGVKVPVSRREFGALELLLLKSGEIVTKTAFLHHLYLAMDEVEVKTIDVIICRLRGKLAAAGARDMIKTVWGSGYVSYQPQAAAKPTNVIPFVRLGMAA